MGVPRRGLIQLLLNAPQIINLMCTKLEESAAFAVVVTSEEDSDLVEFFNNMRDHIAACREKADVSDGSFAIHVRGLVVMKKLPVYETSSKS